MLCDCQLTMNHLGKWKDFEIFKKLKTPTTLCRHFSSLCQNLAKRRSPLISMKSCVIFVVSLIISWLAIVSQISPKQLFFWKQMLVNLWNARCKTSQFIAWVTFQVMMQKHNRHMSFSLYISMLAVTDTICLLIGEFFQLMSTQETPWTISVAYWQPMRYCHVLSNGHRVSENLINLY